MIAFQPLISLGLTVQNGGYLLQTLLDSILSQGFENFELIILDNASTDQTETIGKTYASKDSRIRYYRCPQAQQELWNRNRILDLATGDYFKFITFEEAVVPHFLEHYVNLIHGSREKFSKNCCGNFNQCTHRYVDQPIRFPHLDEAPETPLLSVNSIMIEQEPQEWLSERLNESSNEN
ncbi:glycosyltransferase family 2 protein [Myxacorys almedinensis]|uniref:Glycosyltransferase n=1 Tax=Myxacorys almedinensis A TaxID=2690445 RepID=A0A8J8CIQ0_9CYAN|nr:glycosyltransferase [Myxacorys almedinensis]NDJ18138.1 glycosyltransferase [Myxacorys almedinensis A]